MRVCAASASRYAPEKDGLKSLNRSGTIERRVLPSPLSCNEVNSRASFDDQDARWL